MDLNILIGIVKLIIILEIIRNIKNKPPQFALETASVSF